MTTPTPGPPPSPISDSMRRLQVGIAGVVAVLLLVGLAEIISDRTADATGDTAAANADPAANAEVKAEQPLVELGVQPDTEASEKPKAALPPPGTTVPDLAPDPALAPARAPAP